jgi:hypothetical protein
MESIYLPFSSNQSSMNAIQCYHCFLPLQPEQLIIHI